jgi:hypothetical protein
LSLDILSEPLGYSSNSFASSASLFPFKTAHSLHSTSSARFLAFHYIQVLGRRHLVILIDCPVLRNDTAAVSIRKLLEDHSNQFVIQLAAYWDGERVD